MADRDDAAVHEGFENDFSDLYEGRLDPARRGELEAHLASCARCRGEYEQFREAVSQLALLGRAQAPKDFDDRVADTIHRRSAGRFFGRRAFGDRVPFELLAALALVALIALYLFARWRL
jgi:anti-sigma factor RsiW